MMRVAVFIVSFLVLVLLSGSYFLVWPNTYLSQINISFWPKPVIRKLLEEKKIEEIKVIADGREVRLHYADLGMNLDVNRTMEGLESEGVKDLINNWFSKNTILIQPVFEFTEDFEKKAIATFPINSLKNEGAVFDNVSGLVEYFVEERKARIDTVDLQARLVTFTDFNKKPVVVEMISESSDLERKVEEINKRLAMVYYKGIEILTEHNERLQLGPSEIIGLLEIDTADLVNKTSIDINKEKLPEFVTSKLSGNKSIDWTARLIKESLLKSYNGGKDSPIVLSSDDGPNTDGTLAQKYIEVDLSQQKMYFFENHNLYKTYKVSTGLRYPTPEGNYKIKNKLPMGFSSIFNVWMPWWMAFEYREDIEAYLGIHELPYKLVEGEKIYRFGNYIGNRKTGGCIALSPGDSKEVYDKSFPGMDLVIYQ